MRTLLITLLSSGLASPNLARTDTPRAEYWKILNSALDRGGIDAESALSWLGIIDDQRANELLRSTLSGADGDAIEFAARGMSTGQCRRYLGLLARAALDPSIEPKTGALGAIARAGTTEAIKVLSGIADQGSQPAAGIAFGLLEQLGVAAESALENESVNGRSAWVRETATATLDRTGTQAKSALAAFRAGLHDQDENVRISAALGLAHRVRPDGSSILKQVADEAGSDYQFQALVALGDLGYASPLQTITDLLNSSDESTKGRLVWAVARFRNGNLKALAYRLRLERRSEFLGMLAERLLQPGDPKDARVLQDALAGCSQAAGIIAARRLVQTALSQLAENTVVCGLSSPSPQVQHLAADLALEDPRLWAALASRIADADPIMQMAALSAIEHLGHRDQFDQVVDCFTGENPQVSFNAAPVLASLDPAEAHRVFERGLTSQAPYVRIASAAMLLKLEAN